MQANPDYNNERIAEIHLAIEESKLLIGQKTFVLTVAEDTFLEIARLAVEKYEEDTSERKKRVNSFLSGIPEKRAAERARPTCGPIVVHDKSAEGAENETTSPSTDSKTDKPSASDPPKGPHVSVERGRGKITVDGEEYDANPEWCSIVASLIEANAHYVTGPTMKKLSGCKGKKIWRVISDIEHRMPGIKAYLKHEGNKGYRLLNG